MGYGGGGGGSGSLSGSSDVALNNPVQQEFLGYDAGVDLWTNQSLVGKALTASGGGQETVSSLNASSATDLNLANGNVFSVTLTGNVNFSFSGATNGRACSFGLYLRQDGSGGHSVSWPASVRWSGGEPSLTTTASALDILVFETIDGGNNWYGSLVGVNYG